MLDWFTWGMARIVFLAFCDTTDAYHDNEQKQADISPEKSFLYRVGFHCKLRLRVYYRYNKCSNPCDFVMRVT